MSSYDKIILNKTELAQGEPLIVQFIPEHENRNLCVNPFKNPYLKKVVIKKGGDETKAGFNNLLIPLSDGTYQLIWYTHDWEPGEYYIKVWESGSYYDNIYSEKFEIIPKDEQSEVSFIAAMAGDKILRLFDYESHQEVSIITPGQHLVVGFKTLSPNIISYKNSIELRYTNENLGTIKLLEIRPNKNYVLGGQVEVTSQEVLLQHFNFINHQPFMNISGYCELGIDITLALSSGNTLSSEAKVVFQVIDDTDEPSLEFNPNQPLNTFEVGLFYYGNSKTDEELETLIDNIKLVFKESTKDFFDINLALIGSSPLSEDHPYEAWWESLPHDLNGTSHEDLTPNKLYYFEKLRYLWYYYGGFNPNDYEDYESIPINEKGLLLIYNEVINILSLIRHDKDFIIILTDAGFSKIAGKVPNQNIIILKSFGVSQFEYLSESNIKNLSEPKEWIVNSNEHKINTCMHEFGHMLWTPIRFPDVEGVYLPYNSTKFPIYIEDFSRAKLHNLDYMSYTRNRELIENMKYSDEWINLALMYHFSPKILGATPNKENIVSTDALIEVHFSVPMNKNSVEENFSISPNISGKYEWDSDDMVLKFDPYKSLKSNEEFQVLIDIGVKDNDGNFMISPYQWDFDTYKGKKKPKKGKKQTKKILKGRELFNPENTLSDKKEQQLEKKRARSRKNIKKVERSYSKN